MDPRLRIQLLGEFRIWFDDTPWYNLDKPRLQELLAYLLLHRSAPQQRTHVAYQLWPDSSESQALTNLRKLFFQLRRALPTPDDYLWADATWIAWNNKQPLGLDVADLETLLDKIESRDESDLEQCLALPAIFKGDPLPACYSEWLLPLRQRLHDRVLHALVHAVSVADSRHEYAAGLRIAQEMIRLEPLHETTYRYLIRFHVLQGDRAGALKVYHDCVRLLDLELGVPPAPQTQSLYQMLIRGESELATGGADAEVVAHNTGERPALVGRVVEISRLRNAWKRVGDEGARIALVEGEAGVGKTRLMEEYAQWARLRGATVLYGRAYGAEGALAYAPLTEWLGDEVMRQRIPHLDALWRSEISRLLPDLLTQDANLAHPLPMHESWQRHRFHEALVRAIQTIPTPCLLILEDMQWCDAETVVWLAFLMRTVEKSSLLLVLTARIDEVSDTHPLHELRSQMEHSNRWDEIMLHAFNKAETAQLAHQIAQVEVGEWLGALYRESDGNPLFIVELIRAGFLDSIEHGAHAQLPRSIQAVIEERLRQLSPAAMQVAFISATIGRAFSVDEIQSASDLSDDSFLRVMDELWRRRILRPQGARYDFAHDRIREIAYLQGGDATRRKMHGVIARVLAQVHSERLDDVAGEIASHAEAAGDLGSALRYLQHAARVAQSMAANMDVIALTRRALSLLPQMTLTDSKRMQLELELSAILGSNLLAMRGYGNLEVQQVYARAYELLGKVPENPAHMPILVGLGLYYLVSGQLHRSLLIGRQGLELAERIDDDGARIEAHSLLGPVIEYLGDFAGSVFHFEEVIRLYDSERHRDHAMIYGQDPLIVSRVLLSTSLWHLGDYEGALRELDKALQEARSLGHPYTETFTYAFGGHLHHLLQQPATGAPYSQKGLANGQRYGYPYWIVTNSMILGSAKVQMLAAKSQANTEHEPPYSEMTKVIASMSDAYLGFKATGAGLFRSYYLGLIAEAHLTAGNIAAASEAIEEACLVADEGEDKFWSAEVHRLRGLVLRASGQEELARLSFARALDIANMQGSIATASRIRMQL